MNNRIHIFTGHFGSGKTEVALNFAIKQAKNQNKVTIIDLDIVNPYFRTKDAEGVMKQFGVQVAASRFAGSNVDLPIVPSQVQGIFTDSDRTAVFDVGGDDDGAFALGQYKEYFETYGYQMHFVVNTKRPMTRCAEDIVEMMDRVEKASRLHITDMVNNTNLSGDTDETTLFSDWGEIEKAARIKGVPVSMQSGTKQALAGLPEKYRSAAFEMACYLKKPWENKEEVWQR
jgi:hypothetical protein